MTYISTLPTPPSRSDDPTGFSNKADALLAALPDFVTEANTLSDEVDAMRDDAEAKRAATEALRDATIVIKDAAEDARDAALSYRDTTNTYRGQAETARDQAQTAAAAAGAAAGLPSMTGNAGKQLVVSSGEGGVEWKNAIRRLPIFSPEAASLNAVSIGEIIGDRAIAPSPLGGATGLHATNSMFICTGASAQYVRTSPDGITWTQRDAAPTPLAANLYVAASPSGTVIAIGSGSTATRKSTDHGVTWSAGGALPAAATVGQKIAYANGRFLVFTSGTTGYVSADDGASWTLTTIPTSTELILSIGGVFIVTFDSETYSTSPDGVTWTERTKSGDGGVTRYGDIVLNTNKTLKTHYSQDGINWTELPIGFSYSPSWYIIPVLINGVFANIYGRPEIGIDFTIHNGKEIHRQFNTTTGPSFIVQNATHSVFVTATTGFSINHADTLAYFEG